MKRTILDVVSVGPLQGYRQSPGAGALTFCTHTFRAAADGQLEHLTDSALRATIPPEGFADYAMHWPEAQPVIDALTRPTEKAAPAASTSTIVETVSDRKQKAGKRSVIGKGKRGSRS